MGKIVSIAIVGTSLFVLIRATKPEYALPIGIGTGVALLMVLMEPATCMLQALQTLGTKFGVSDDYQRALLKMTGIAYMAQFASDVCRDHGASSAAEKVELGGRICVLTCALPAAVALLESGVAMMNEAVP